jgi:hypothetical protein
MEKYIVIIFTAIVGIFILYQKIIKGNDWFQNGGDEYNEFD